MTLIFPKKKNIYIYIYLKTSYISARSFCNIQFLSLHFWSYFFFFEKITDLHTILWNSTESSHVPFTQLPSSVTLQNRIDSIPSRTLMRKQPRYRTFPSSQGFLMLSLHSHICFLSTPLSLKTTSLFCIILSLQEYISGPVLCVTFGDWLFFTHHNSVASHSGCCRYH